MDRYQQFAEWAKDRIPAHQRDLIETSRRGFGKVEAIYADPIVKTLAGPYAVETEGEVMMRHTKESAPFTQAFCDLLNKSA